MSMTMWLWMSYQMLKMLQIVCCLKAPFHVLRVVSALIGPHLTLQEFLLLVLINQRIFLLGYGSSFDRKPQFDCNILIVRTTLGPFHKISLNKVSHKQGFFR